MDNANQTMMDTPSGSIGPRNPDYDEIAGLAYQLWKSRGCPMGSPEVDWCRAESELKARKVSAAACESKNKALVLEAFDTLFNKRDYAAAERFWSDNYIQHSAHIAPGREGLFNLTKSLPPTLKYEPGRIVAEGDLVMIHGRFSGFGQPTAWIAADIVRMAGGVLTEHWDVIQDEASRESSKSGLPMFGEKFGGGAMEAAVSSPALSELAL
jgi:predicted SnoaL-like aldol condensation-catalyzing enzyme